MEKYWFDNQTNKFKVENLIDDLGDEDSETVFNLREDLLCTKEEYETLQDKYDVLFGLVSHYVRKNPASADSSLVDFVEDQS